MALASYSRKEKYRNPVHSLQYCIQYIRQTTSIKSQIQSYIKWYSIWYKAALYIENYIKHLESIRYIQWYCIYWYRCNYVETISLSQKRSQCILGLFGGTKNTVVDVKYVRIEIHTIKYQLSTLPKNEMSPFHIKHLIQMCVSIFLVPPNKGFARLDPGLWEMANAW